MKKPFLTILVSLLLLLAPTWGGMVIAQTAPPKTATLTFGPASVSRDVSNRITVDVSVNTAGQDTIGVDGVVNYDATKLDFIAPTSNAWLGGFYSQDASGAGTPKLGTDGRIWFSTTTPAVGPWANGSGTVAHLIFTAHSGVTSAAFSFKFTSLGYTGNDTNVVAHISNPLDSDIWNGATGQANPTTITITDYVPPVVTPVISNLNPNHGAASGGYQVEINGTNFGTTSGATVTWAGSSVTATWVSSSLIRIASIPSGTAGGTASVVVTAGGKSSAAATFSYDSVIDNTPTISNLNPNHGAASGGYQVEINGTNFGTTSGATVTWAGSSVTATWVSSSLIRIASIPSGTAGGTASVVVTAGGKSSAAAIFSYDTVTVNDPYISYLDPNSGLANVDVVVTIYGTNFGTTSGSVTFGQYGATISSWSDTQIKVTAPKLGQITSSVTYEVKVTRSDGKYATSYYTYLAPTSTGGTTTETGMPMGVWAGLISANGVLAFLIKRRFF